MKISAYILAVYMFLLAFVPCSDGGNSVVEIISHLFGIEHFHKEEHSAHTNHCGDDTCPPFCICSCCSTAISTPERILFSLKIPTPVPGTSPVFIPNIFISQSGSSVWHPPAKG